MKGFNNNGINQPSRFQSELLSRREAAAYLGVSEQTLAIWKCTGRYNLACVKVGRLVKYKKSDLDDFIQRRSISA
jgi:excisionase family DNA binding protein